MRDAPERSEIRAPDHTTTPATPPGHATDELLQQIACDALNALASNIAILDRRGIIIAVNHAWRSHAQELRPASPEQLCEGADWLAGCRAMEVHSDNPDSTLIRTLEEVLGGQLERHTFEMAIPTAQGRRWLSASIARIEGDGPGQFIVTQSDITLRKQADDLLRAHSMALTVAANAVVITDSAGVVEWVNHAFTRMAGYTAEECIGRTVRELQNSSLHSPTIYRQLWETIRAGEVWRGELINRRKDGSYYTEEQTITPVLDSSGQITRYVSIKQDVTARKQYERELEAVAQVSDALRAAATRSEMMPIVLDHLIAQMHIDGAAIESVDGEHKELRTEIGRGVWASYAGSGIPALAGLGASVIAGGQPYLRNDISSAHRSDPIAMRQRAIAGVPLVSHGITIGVLWVCSQRLLGDHDLRLMIAIGNLAGSALHRAALHEETELRLRRLSALRTVDHLIVTTFDLRMTLDLIVEQTTAQLRVDAAAVLLLNPHTLALEHSSGYGFRSGAIEHASLRLGHHVAGMAALDRRTIGVADMSASEIAQPRLPQLAGEDFIAHYAAPMIVRGQVRGVLAVFHRARLEVDAEWTEFLETLAQQAAIAVDNAQLFEGLQRSNIDLSLAYDATIEGWSRALDLRDKETEGHTLRVPEMTERLARAMGISDAELVHVRRGALLHDIGKMGIPDHILLKPGPLTDEEWVIMRRHPQYAYDLLSPIAYLHPALDIPFCHHERWDGAGYPRGLRGEQIPLSARLFAVVDVWDALRSDRPYRAAWPEQRVRDHISSLSGTHFDPRAVEAFLSLTERRSAE